MNPTPTPVAIYRVPTEELSDHAAVGDEIVPSPTLAEALAEIEKLFRRLTNAPLFLGVRLGPRRRFDHLFVGSAAWILSLLLRVALTWSGIILHLAHTP